MLARPAWPDVLDVTFRAIYGDEIKQYPTQYQNIFNTYNSDRASEKDSAASGFGKLVLKPEGDALAYEDPVPGYPVTYTHVARALGSIVTWEMYSDDQFNVMRRIPRQLAVSVQRTKEAWAADIFNYGFTAGGGGSAPFTAGDSKALFADDHPNPSGIGTGDNKITGVLNEANLEIALVAMRKTLDMKGQIMMVQPDTLVVPPALELEARILLESQGRTGVGNNDVNPYYGRLNLVVWDFLTSDTAWFVVDSKSHMLNWFDRENRGVEGPYYDFDTKSAKWSVALRASVGFSDWRGVFGSTGTV